MGIAQAQFVEFGLDHTPVHAFGLVDGDEYRPLETAQAIGNFLVVGGDAVAPVDHEDHGIGLGDGLFGLAGHLVQDAVLDQGFEAAGIDHGGACCPGGHGRNGGRGSGREGRRPWHPAIGSGG